MKSTNRPSKTNPRRPAQPRRPTDNSPEHDKIVRAMSLLMRFPPPANALPPAPPAPSAPTPTNQTVPTSLESGTWETVGREADSAWRGVQRIMALLNVEKKVAVTPYSSTAVPATSVIWDITSNIAQGISGLQRIGDSIKVSRVRIKGVLSYGTAACSVTLVLGRSRDSAPVVGNVFQFTGSNAGQNFPATVDKPADRWLKSKYVGLNAVTATFVPFEFDVNINADTTYQPTTTTVATGSVWFAAISDLPAGATTPNIYFTTAIEYVDN